MRWQAQLKTGFGLDQWFSKCGPGPEVSVELVRNAVLWLHPSPTESESWEGGRDPAIYLLRGLPTDSDVCSCLRTPDLNWSEFWRTCAIVGVTFNWVDNAGSCCSYRFLFSCIGMGRRYFCIWYIEPNNVWNVITVQVYFGGLLEALSTHSEGCKCLQDPSGAVGSQGSCEVPSLPELGWLDVSLPFFLTHTRPTQHSPPACILTSDKPLHHHLPAWRSVPSQVVLLGRIQALPGWLSLPSTVLIRPFKHLRLSAVVR